MKTLHIEQVENGFIVHINYDGRVMIGQRKVFNTLPQLNRFLSEYFKTELKPNNTELPQSETLLF